MKNSDYYIKQSIYLDDVVDGEWELNTKGEVVVMGNVDLRKSTSVLDIPYKFDIVLGDFDCSNCSLSTLKNAPNEISGSFLAKGNTLKTLEGLPTTIKGYSTNSKTYTHSNVCDVMKNPLVTLEHFNNEFNCLYFDYTESIINYFKTADLDSIIFWDKLYSYIDLLNECPMVINKLKPHISKKDLRLYLESFPQIKLYLD